MIASGHLGSYLLLLLSGAGVTLELSLGALVLGSLGGLVLGAMRSSRLRLLKVIALLYTEALRSTPFVILLFLIYYAVPLALDTDIPPYPAAISALSLHCSAYMAEVVRSGIEAIPKGQSSRCRARPQLFPDHGAGRPAASLARHDPADDRGLCQHAEGIPRSPRSSALSSCSGRGWRSAKRTPGRSTADVLLAVAFGYFVMCFTLSRLGLQLERRTSRELPAGRGRNAVGAALRL